jgi:[acyl-carrier-protein] S-malonyltransferase
MMFDIIDAHPEEAAGGLRWEIWLLFPGQGSQYVGMGKSLYDGFDEARAVFAEASEAAGVDMARLCFEGPESELNRTENTQPAILTVSLAAVSVLRAMHINPGTVAGHSSASLTAEARGRPDRTTVAVSLTKARQVYAGSRGEGRGG